MRSRVLGILGMLLAAGVLGTATPLVAQTPDTVARPFVRGGVYDKPFQTRLFGRAAFGGYAEAHARFERVDGASEESGFVAKRFNLFASARVSDFVRFAAELEFEDGAREIALEFAAIDLRIHPALALRGGMILSPLGRFNLAHDSPLNEFTDRPLVSTELIGVALSEPGFGALGQLGVGGTSRVTYELYATNGYGDGLITDAADGTRIPLGKHNAEDNNGSPAFVGRVAWSPRVGFEVGLSAHHGAYNVFEVDGVAVDRRRNVTIGVIDAEATVLGVHVRGEAARASIDIPDGLAGIYASAQQGVYVEVVREFGHGWVRTMKQSAFGVKARFDHVDFDSHKPGNSRMQVTVGLNFRPTQDSALKFDFVRGRLRDEFNNVAQHSGILFSLATYF